VRLAIIGRTEILYNTAIQLSQSHDIGLIITSKEAPEYGKGAGDYEELANGLGIPFYNTSNISELTERIEKCPPLDLGISMNYTGIIPQSVINQFRVGILNAHGGDLPRYRGNACQAWAIINGEERIGLCIHYMTGGEIDSGDIIMREYFPLSINTRIGEVYNWMDEQIPLLFLKAVEKLEEDPEYVLERQSKDPKDALRCYPRKPEDGKIDWQASAEHIIRLVNASSEPFSGAFATLRGKNCTIWRAELYPDNENWCGIPGQIVEIDSNNGSVVVLTGSDKISVKEIEYDGLRCQPATIINSVRERFAESKR